MKIIQLVPVLSFGDAVGNNAISLKESLMSLGYETELYAQQIDARLPKGTAKHINQLKRVDEDDVILYQFSTGHEMNLMLDQYHCHKIVQYHNVTPPQYFDGYNHQAYLSCKQGLEDIKFLADTFEYALADSDYNKEDLVSYGYKCQIDILPILIAFDDYQKKPNARVIEKYSDGYTNILFTGRVVPNKKHEDLIDTFYYYKKYINPKSRLILVGSQAGINKYYKRLEMYVQELELEDVIFTGQVKFADILAYYHLADVFLCMSEHEGFCVPLVEAMYFGVPIIARDTSAIASTLGGSGILLKDNDAIMAAEMINRVITDKGLKEKIIENQNIRLKDFEHSVIKEQFKDYMVHYIERVRR